MPDLLAEMNECIGPTGFNSPLHVWDGWHFFVDDDGFLPSANNLLLVLKLIAWKKGESRQFTICVGNESNGSVAEYKRGEQLPKDFVTGCIITSHFYFLGGREALVTEVRKSLDRLIDFVKKSTL